jgi:hypothetical protein
MPAYESRMKRRKFLHHLLGYGCATTLAGATSGCGTILHPERVGRPHSQQIDWKIVALDGLGLILFFVPGVVAFVVDFCTGAIYLPYDECDPCYGGHPYPPAAGPPDAVIYYSSLAAAGNVTPVITAQQRGSNQPRQFKRVAMALDQLHLPRIEQVVSQHLGRSVALDDQQVRLSQLPQIDRYEEQVSHHKKDRRFGTAIRSLLERFKPG